MNVLHVIPAIAPRYGGPSEAVLGMCGALDARGVAALVATTDADGPGRLPVAAARELLYGGTRAVFFPRLDDRFKYSPQLSRWLGGHVGRFDIVHIHALFSHASLAAAQACRRAGVPYVVRPLGSLDPWGLGRHRLLKRVLRRVAVDRMLHNAAAVHFTTAEEWRRAAAVLPDLRGVVVPLGIDDDCLTRPAADPTVRMPMIVSIGRLHPVKNLEAVIRAFLQWTARSGRRDWQLVLAGDGDADYRRQLVTLAGDAGGEGRVTMPGWVGAVDKRALLDRAALFVQVSHQESFGLSLVEAMARGVPVIVSRSVGLSSEIAEARAGWVMDGDAGAVAAAFDDAASDPAERATRAGNARRLAGRFGWSAVAAAMHELYIGLAETRRGPLATPSTVAAPVVPARRGVLR